MQVPVFNIEGETVGQVELDESIFNVPMNEAVVHQALVRQRANARVGTANTKTRGEVSGSGRKLYRQKHTGLARAGQRRSPTRRHGGVAFGPKPRSYRQRMPKKMRRLALKCLLSAKVADNEFKVIDKLELEQPKTKRMLEILEALEIDSSALFALASPDANIVKSARNLEGIKITQARLLNVVDLLSYRILVITLDGLRLVESIWGERNGNK